MSISTTSGCNAAAWSMASWPVAASPTTVVAVGDNAAIYVSTNATKRPEVREFVEFYNKNAATLVKEVKYVPLPAAAYTYNLDTLTKNRVGTKFGGENLVGVTIEQLMKMEAK